VGSLDGEKGGRSAERGVARNVNTENSYSSVKSNVNGEWMGGKWGLLWVVEPF